MRRSVRPSEFRRSGFYRSGKGGSEENRLGLCCNCNRPHGMERVGLMAEWLGKGLQNLVQRFESASDLACPPLHCRGGFHFHPPPHFSGAVLFRDSAFSVFSGDGKLFRNRSGGDGCRSSALRVRFRGCGFGRNGSKDAVRRRPVPAGAERDVSGPGGRIARRRENRMPRACKARGIRFRGERGVSAPPAGKRRCRRSWRVWG